MECLRHITHVCLHVERVIEMLCQMYMLLGGVIPITVIRGGDGTKVDKIMTVCATLCNMCPGIVLAKVEHGAMQPCHDAVWLS